MAIAFQQRFTRLSDAQQLIYYVTLLSTTVAAAFLIAPSAYHRLTFRYQRKGS